MDADTWQRSDAVLDRLRARLDSDREAAVATLVGVEGSAYRRPGAKRLLDPDGEDSGTVVPGCLDARLQRLAASVLDDDEATLARFDLRGDDTWGLGVGCDGVVTLLVEPLDDSLGPALDAVAAGRTSAVVTVLDAGTDGVAVGDRAVFDASSSAVTSDFPAWLDSRLADGLDTDERATGTLTIDGPEDAAEVFVDWLEPPPRLVAFGTGPDIDPLIEAARLAGFRPTVVSFRGEVDAGRFPDTVTVSTRPADVRDALDFDAETVAVVATHNLVDDRLTVEQLLATPVAYVGVVGSRERFERLQASLEVSPDPDRLYGPAGLDIGAETPEQIALSLVTEAMAVAGDRAPGHLRERDRPIHDRSSPDSTQQ